VMNDVKGRKAHDDEDRLLIASTLHLQIVGVLDGHGGGEAADFVRTRLLSKLTSNGGPGPDEAASALEEAFFAVDSELLAETDTKSGACACVCAISSDSITVANVGDSRAVLGTADGAEVLHRLHNPSEPSERARIEAWGTFVTPNGRLMGQLSVSRAFGDRDFKITRSEFDAMVKHESTGAMTYIKDPRHTSVCVTVEPDICTRRLRPGDDFVLVASDGLFDSMSAEDAAAFVRSRSQGFKGREVTSAELSAIASELCTTAAAARSPHDDITVAIAWVSR